METEKIYTLKTIDTDCLFPMLGIVSKIGIKELKSCFDSDSVKGYIKDFKGKVDDESNKDKVAEIGINVALDIAGIIISNLPKCKDDIYTFLSELSGMTCEQIGKLPLSTFAEMVIDVIKKPEFSDFFTVVMKSFK